MIPGPIAGLLLVSTLAALPGVSVETRSPPSSDLLLDVPYVAQSELLCGGAAATMVLRYWGDASVVAEDFAPLVDQSAGGIHTRALTDAVRARGWTPLAAPRSIDELDAEVARGRPVLALVEDRPGVFHYVVLVAVTATSVVLHDPARSPYRVVSRANFDQRSAKAERWSLVILPGERSAASAAGLRAGATRAAGASGAERSDASEPQGQLAAITGAPTASTVGEPSACPALVAESVRLARSGDREAAERGLTAATALCPERPDAWRELAGIRFLDEQYAASAALAERATTQDPADAHGWETLAASRFLDGDTIGALDAWNAIGQPRLRDIKVVGMTRTFVPVVVRRSGLVPGRVLSATEFSRANRRLDLLPIASSQEIRLEPVAEHADVTIGIAERHVLPRWPLEWINVAIRAAFVDEVRVDVAGLARQGEMWRPSFRWSANRPQVRVELTTPSPSPLPGMMFLEAFWERQTYRTPGIDFAQRETRRRVAIHLGDWATDGLFWRAGVGTEKVEDRRFVTFEGELGTRWLGDHLALTNLWRSYLGATPDSSFRMVDSLLSWRSTTRRGQPLVTALSGFRHVSHIAPRAFWPVASSSSARGSLARGEPLFEHGVITSGLLGRTLAHATVEYQHPIVMHAYGALSVAGFVDLAQARRRSLDDRSDLRTAIGAGARIESASSDGAIRLDVAYDTTRRSWNLSAGYVVPWGGR